MKYYGVKKGRKPGIYKTWDECKEQVLGYSGAEYKSFKKEKDAEEFIAGIGGTSKLTRKEVRPREVSMEDEELENLKDNEAVAYVDGSFNLEDFSYSYGVVYLTSEGKKTYSGRDNNKDLSLMRNVSGELKGAMEAMKIAIEDKKEILYLHYDYMGIEKWALGEWKANKEGTKKYKEFYKAVKDILDVKFIKVRAHSGIKYNEEADQLAKDALYKKI